MPFDELSSVRLSVFAIFPARVFFRASDFKVRTSADVPSTPLSILHNNLSPRVKGAAYCKREPFVNLLALFADCASKQKATGIVEGDSYHRSVDLSFADLSLVDQFEQSRRVYRVSESASRACRGMAESRASDTTLMSRRATIE
jgi:hypothetical protein